MSKTRKIKKRLAATALALSMMASVAYAADMPMGGSVVTGTVTGLNTNPASGDTITATSNALINWNSFDIGAGKLLNFDTGSGYVLMNQVTGNTMSNIYGTLRDLGNGHLILANPNGIIFRGGSVVDANYLTLSTMQNLDVTGFNKLTSGGWGPEINTNDAIVAFEGGDNPSTVKMKHYLGVLAGSIMLDDYVSIQTENSQVDLTATNHGQYSLLMGTSGFYSNGTTYTTTGNAVKIGQNTVLNVNGNSYNSVSILGGQVKVGDYAQFNTGSSADMSNVIIQAVATKNDSEGDSSKVYTATKDNVIIMGLASFSNGGFRLIGGSLAGETESFKEKFTKVGGGVTPPPTPPPTPKPESTTENMAKGQQMVQNLLDSQRYSDSGKVVQGTLPMVIEDKNKLYDVKFNWQDMTFKAEISGTQDHVSVVDTGRQPGSNIGSGLQGLTVKEAAARSRSLAKQYMHALQQGKKDEASRLEAELKRANDAVREAKAREKEAKNAAVKVQSGNLSQGGTSSNVVVENSSNSTSRINDLIGRELLERETAARNKLVKAKTSQEKAEAMKELDEIHRQETEKVNEALAKEEEQQRIVTMQQELEAKRQQDEQLKTVGGKAGGEALERAAKRASDAVKRVKDLEKQRDELKNKYKEVDKAARQLSDQYYKARDAGASKEELEKIAKEWNELDRQRTELNNQLDKNALDMMDARGEAEKQAAEYDRLQSVAKEAQQEIDKLNLDLAKAKDEQATKDAEFSKAFKEEKQVSDQIYDIEKGEEIAAEAAAKEVDNAYEPELQRLKEEVEQAVKSGDDERAEALGERFSDALDKWDAAKQEAMDKAKEEYNKEHPDDKALLQKLKEEEQALEKKTNEARESLKEADRKVFDLEKVEPAIREKAEEMLTAPDKIEQAKSEQIKAGVDLQIAKMDLEKLKRDYGAGSMEASLAGGMIAQTAQARYNEATAKLNDLQEKSSYQPGQSANVFSAARQQAEAATKSERKYNELINNR